jgi:uncharacterized protein
MVRQRWRDVSFLHWAYEPAVVQSLIPADLKVDTFDGRAWVGLTPFLVEDFGLPRLPAVPHLSTFPETNVRTYVVGPDGRDGLWFLTLEVDSVTTAIAARSVLGVPYRWADMSVDSHDPYISYRSRRRLGRHVGHDVVVQRGRPCHNDPLAEWLTGRWRAWTRIGSRLVTVAAEHQPWPLFSGEVVSLEQNLLASLGLPRPDDQVLLHMSPGVTAKLGWPERVSTRP